MSMMELKYVLFGPEDLSVQDSWPLIIFLHGSGERGDDLELAKKHGLPQYIEAGYEVPGFVVVPQCPLDVLWNDLIDPLDAMLANLLTSYPIDRDRVYLTGFSMGGFGGWQWAISRPERFAALVPVGGSGLHFKEFVLTGDICALRSLPMWIIHSYADEAVPIKGADEAVAALAICEGNYRYTRYPDADHVETCRRAYYDPALYEWMLNQKRQQVNE
jgi:predicted peptidase